MSQSKLIGARVLFNVSEPWDFGEKFGTTSLFAIIKTIEKNATLLHLLNPIEYKGIYFEYLAAFSRHENQEISDITKGSTILVHLIPIPTEITKQKDTDISPSGIAASWRGWSLIASLKIDN